MTISDRATIEIADESTFNEVRHQLYIDGSRRALVSKKKGGPAQMRWQIYGPMYWGEAKILLEGLLELSLIADSLTGG